MSETSTETTGSGTTETGTGSSETTTYTPPATQADLDRIIADRVNRTKAQFKDYNDLKAKATQFDQLTESQKTELEKAQGETTRWQTEAEKWRSTSVASTIKALAATDFEYPDDAVGALDPAKYLDAGGTVDERAIQADLAALLEARPKWRRGEGETQTPRTPRPNTAQGAGGQSSSDPAQQFAAILRGAANS